MKELLPLLLLLYLALLWPASPALADNDAPEDMILILDASGSMWGQIDGVNKIVIAKDVVEGLVRGLPPEQGLGFVAYGHRREGDCKDIETLAEVGAGRDGVIASLRSLTARGKTPLSRSVEHAARTLDYTRQAASVVVVSDGLENCGVDPCELARTLEEQGLDFTVHVVGFDVSEQERQGLTCIASETGGTFVAADNAEELATALSTVAGAGASYSEGSGAPVPSQLALKATVLSGGPLIQSKLSWSVTAKESGEQVFEQANTGSAETELLPGVYTATASWTGWQDGSTTKTGELTFEIKPQQHKVITIPIDLGLNVTLDVPDSTPEGVGFDVTWTGPDDLGAYIHVASSEDGPRRAIYLLSVAKARSDTGVTELSSPVTASLGAPSTEGTYEVRYVLDQPRIILARKLLLVTDGNFAIQAPEQAPVSSTVKVAWSGNATAGDMVTVIAAGKDKAFENGYTSKLNPDGSAELVMPADPGDYEIRYVLANGYTTYPNTQYAVQAVSPITLTPVTAGIRGPREAIGGSQVEVSVDLPADWEDDFVSIVQPGALKHNRDSWITLSRAEIEEETFSFQAPNIEGDYELVYFLAPGNSPIARQPITISRAAARVDAPASIRMGEDVTVRYEGPAYSKDRVIITPADEPDLKMWGWGTRYGFGIPEGVTQGTHTIKNYTFAEPGQYEVRYVTGLQHQVLARATINVVE